MPYGGFDLTGRVAFVTGASRGIGRAIALGLAESGADLFLCSRKAADLEAVARDAAARGRRAEFAAADVSSLPQIRAAVDGALSRYGRIDILVNNAGINVALPALDVTEENWDQHVEINLKGAFFCAQAVARGMVSRRSGKIINIASTLGLVGGNPRSVYCATKGGLVLLTKALALEWAPHNVQVNAIAPTFIVTDLTRPYMADAAYMDKVKRNIPLGRLGNVQDVVGAAILLASPAADLITGITLPVDGGWTAQ